MSGKAQVIICGAGIAGVSAAYHLSKAGFRDILIVDARPPLSLTSNMSTEGYRNWWPDPELRALMERSIDLLEQLAAESGNTFRMNQRGYLYVTGEAAKVDAFTERAGRIAGLGVGELRVHTDARSDYAAAGEGNHATGADLLLDPSLIHTHFPYLTTEAVAALHVRRAGWLGAQQLGMYMLEKARQDSLRIETAEVEGIVQHGGRIQSVVLSNGERVDCEMFVNAAGPFLKHVGRLLGIEIPVETELHLKVSFADHLGVIPRDAPMMIWDDEQLLPWEPDERLALQDEPEGLWLTEPLPAGVHARAEGSEANQTVLMLWDYAARSMAPVLPLPLDEAYPEVVLRGLSTMLPGLTRYFGRAPRPYVDGGYYVKTPENRLLCGPLPVGGAYILGALSGYGIMASCATGELLAAHMTGGRLPAYAPAFSMDRYDDPRYTAQLAVLDRSGQL
jgi:glycine/D-amino acid oxidase-like deaminating enzyme